MKEIINDLRKKVEEYKKRIDLLENLLNQSIYELEEISCVLMDLQDEIEG